MSGKRVVLLARIKHLPHIASFWKTRIILLNYKVCINLTYIITNLFAELDTRVKICYHYSVELYLYYIFYFIICFAADKNLI